MLPPLWVLVGAYLSTSQLGFDSFTGRTEEPELVVEDEVEGESLVGGGKASILRGQQDEQEDMNTSAARSKNKLRGMSGPISSNLDVSWLNLLPR